jgi:type IV pilus assembly protein PilN
MIRINLLAADRPTKSKKRATAAAPGAMQAYLLLGAFVGLAVLGCLGAYLYMSNEIKKLDENIAKAEERQRQLQAIKVQVDALEKKRATFQQKVDLIERLKAEQSGPVHMLDEISKSLPDFVWLTNLDQSAAGIRLAGQSNGLTAVADFISALERSGWFPSVDLVSSTEAANVVTFAVNARFVNPEVAAKVAAAAARKPNPGSTPAGAVKPR